MLDGNLDADDRADVRSRMLDAAVRACGPQLTKGATGLDHLRALDEIRRAFPLDFLSRLIRGRSSSSRDRQTLGRMFAPVVLFRLCAEGTWVPSA